MEADFTDGSPRDQTDVEAVVEDEGNQHAPVVGANLFGRLSRHETQHHCQSSKGDGQRGPSDELGTIGADAVYSHAGSLLLYKWAMEVRCVCREGLGRDLFMFFACLGMAQL